MSALLVGLGCEAWGAASCVSPPGLVAWWPGERSGVDLVGGNTLTLFNGADYTNGQVGLAFTFDGINDRAQLPDVEALKLTKSMTIEAWVYPDSPSPDVAFVLIRADDRAGLDPYFLSVAGPLAFFRVTDASNHTEDLVVGMATNRWTHLAATLDDATGRMRIYLDGVLAGEKITAIRPFRDLDPASNPGVGIGNHPGYPTSPWQFPFRGKIDELSVYNRALDAAEVAAIYAAGAAGKCKTPVVVRVDNRIVTGNSLRVTNSATIQLEPAFAGGSVFYTLDGSSPGAGLLYGSPLVVTQSVVLKAIAYDAAFAQAGELVPPLALTLVSKPVFTLQPLNQTVAIGATLTFRVAVSGVPPPTLQWFRNGVAIAGAVGPSLSLTNVQVANAGTYTVIASNTAAAVTSSAALLAVLGTPSITQQPAGTNINLTDTAAFCVTASGSGTLTYQWRVNGVNIPRATNACVFVPNVQASNAGAYDCLVANGVAVVPSARAVLVVLDFPPGPFPADDFDNRVGLFGATGDLEVDNIGATKQPGEPNPAGKPGGSSVWYTWTAPATGIATFRTTGSAFDTLLGVYRGNAVNALNPIVSDEDRGGFLTSLLQFRAVNNTDYNIAVDGLSGAQGKFILIWSLETTADVLPVITNAPVGQTVRAGSNATFSVTAGGTALRYQWYRSGLRIQGATNATLVRTNVQAADVGDYTVAITNSQQRGVISPAADLEIGPFSSARSVDKVEDLITGVTPFSFLPASAAASVSVGSLGSQILNTTNATTSAVETPHCGIVGGSSRWFQLHAGGTATMEIDTFNSTFDTVLAVYISTGPGAYPSKLITCNDDAFPGVHWSRVTFPATNGVDYFVAVDGPSGVSGLVQLNWALGSPPVLTNTVITSNQVVAVGEALTLNAPGAAGAPTPLWQWYLDATPLAGATNRTFVLGSVARTNGGTYSVVSANGIGAITTQVARVTVKVPLRLAVNIDGQGTHLLGTNTSQSVLVRWSTNLANWFPLYTNNQPDHPFSVLDPPSPGRPRRFYQALPGQ